MKRFLCLVIALLMILPSTVAMAAKQFSDVSADNQYTTAIYTLADFGIIKGDAGADTFRPNDGISREEFSVIMVRCLGLGELQVNITEYPFTDVNPQTCDAWSINATKIAYDQGIIKGMGDGTFAPKADVTYEQAVKMIVCAIGYEPHAINQGGWPNGYISVARDLGITRRAESPQQEAAPRGVIAQLIYNALDVDLMTAYIDSQGTQRYSSVEGQNLLNQKLKLTKETGVITAIQNSSLGSDAVGVDADEVKIDFLTKFKVGETNAAEYFGQRVTYYYKTENDVKTIVSVAPTTDNKIVELSSDNIKTIDSAKVEYYEDPNDTSVLDTLTLNTPAYLIYNGAQASLNNPITIESGSAKLIDNDADGAINVIIVEAAVTVVVDAVDAANYIIYDAYDQSNRIELNPDSTDIINITKNGYKVEFSSILKGDVLLVSQSSNATGSVTKNVKIITNTVSGTINQLSSDYEEAIINNSSYQLSDKFINYIKSNPSFNFAIDNRVTCYLDDNNKIVAATVTSVAATSSLKYGYLIAADVDLKKEIAQFRIFTEDNNNVVLTVADTVRINGTTYSYDDSVNIVRQAGALNLTNQDANYSDSSGYDLAQLIEYSVNSTGKIDNIITITQSGDTTSKLVLSKSYTSSKYSSTTSMIGTGVSINESTKIFFVPSDRATADDYSVRSKSSLINNKTYAFEAYDASTTNVASVVIVYGDTGTITVNDASAPLVLVNTITQVMQNGINANKLVCYENGNETTYYTTDTSVLNNVKTGDVIRLQFNTSGNINNVRVMYAAGSLPALENRLVHEGDSSSTINSQYLTVFGHVYGRDDSLMTVSLHDIDANGNLNNSNLYSIKFSDSTKYFIYDQTKQSITTTVKESLAGYANAKTGASKIFAYASYGTAKMIMIIK